MGGIRIGRLKADVSCGVYVDVEEGMNDIVSSGHMGRSALLKRVGRAAPWLLDVDEGCGKWGLR